METENWVRLDLGRRNRLGMVEAIWGENKSAEQIASIVRRFRECDETALVTRLNEEKARAVLGDLKDLPVQHDPVARCLVSPPPPMETAARESVAIVTGGLSDLHVAAEARLALACHGIGATLISDVGVAGLHRLLGQLDRLDQSRVLIVCAGMEGALPTVVAGLMHQPVIGVPVAVGYGVSSGGTAALNGMLASCAPGLTVVNIDNGYGAAMAALRVLRGMDRLG